MTATNRPAARRPTAQGTKRPAKKPGTKPPPKKPGKTAAASRAAERQANPWNALWAMMVGFFMILVDSTIVAVANPAIMEKLNTDYDTVIWVTSAYLLAYAVPLLLAGRLGDRFGPKNLYLIGLFIFTGASLWCGLSGSVEVLIAARVLQGIGAGLLTPQTLSTITRIFPPERRGVAMSVWGATAGVATLVGPLAGGVLVDSLGWQWIFFVNVPIGVIGLGLAVWLVPVLPTEKHRFDVLGVVLSGIGMFLIVFALQEGQSHHWDAWIWGMIAGGVLFMAVFIVWQALNKGEPLIPLRIFRDRDFSLANVGIATIGFVVTAMILPLMFYLQAVCGLSPTRAALLTAPMAVATGVLAPIVGRIVDRSHPRPIIGFGFSMLAIALTWLSIEMTPLTPIWRLVLPMTAMGVGMAFIWAPLAATATRNLPPQLAGAGSGVYNATRQVGSVLGSASMAAFMTSRISAEAPSGGGGSGQNALAVIEQLPDALQEPFASALAQSTLLPAFIALFGVVAALFLLGFGQPAAAVAAVAGRRGDRSLDSRRESPDREHDFDLTDVIPVISDDISYEDDRYRREYASQPDLFRRTDTDAYPRAARSDPFYDDRYDDRYEDAYEDDAYKDDGGYIDDDDDYVEYVVDREPPYAPERQPEPPVAAARTTQTFADEPDTEPLAVRVEHPRQTPAEVWHSDPVQSWRSLSDESGPAPAVEPIGFAHNGFHVHDDEDLAPLPPPAPAGQHRPAHGVAYEASYPDSYSASYDDAYEAFDNAYDSFKFFADNESFGNSHSARGGYRGHWSNADFFDRPDRPNHFDLPEYQSPPPAGDYDSGSRHSQPDEPAGRSRHLLPEADERPAARHHRKESDSRDETSSYGRHSLPHD